MTRYIILPKLKVLNANAHSSPYTIGFPAITSWLGMVHFLQRELHKIDEFKDIFLKGVAIVAHDVQLREFRQQRNFSNPLIGMAFPLTKEGNRAPFIEEAKCSLIVSLIIETEGCESELSDKVLGELNLIIHKGTKVASGDAISVGNPIIVSGDPKSCFARIKKEVTPGYALIERRELIIEDMRRGMDALDSILSYMEVSHKCNDEEPYTWETQKKELGWLVPIGVGFKQISNQFHCDMQRDKNTPHMYAESIVTLGEFVMPYRIKSIEKLFWRYRYDATEGLYLCINE